MAFKNESYTWCEDFIQAHTPPLLDASLGRPIVLPIPWVDREVGICRLGPFYPLEPVTVPDS